VNIASPRSDLQLAYPARLFSEKPMRFNDKWYGQTIFSQFVFRNSKPGSIIYFEIFWALELNNWDNILTI